MWCCGDSRLDMQHLKWIDSNIGIWKNVEHIGIRNRAGKLRQPPILGNFLNVVLMASADTA